MDSCQTINPLIYNPIGNPTLIFANNPKQIVADVIDLREDGDFTNSNDRDHMMIQIIPGRFACQSFSGYNQVPVTGYMIPGATLTYIALKNMNPLCAQAMCKAVNDRLSLPFWCKTYDFLGILGQAVGQPWIHNPWQEYCSEDGVRVMKYGAPFLQSPDSKFIMTILNQSNPQQVYDQCLARPDIFTVMGNYSYGS